ncbi:MAG: prephenate dehydratase, partial [Candidatus Omnitrophica bacterium CG1_02_49_10]
YKTIESLNKGPLKNSTLKAVYREIMSGSLNIEKPLKIAYLGPQATFTHLASLKKFGSSVTYVDCSNITDVFLDVEKGNADYGVVPIENSTEGVINHTLDMFIDSDLKVCSEVILDIAHSLLGKCARGRIKRVYSKREVFGQCRMWLEANLAGRDLIEVSSTTKAAELASKDRLGAAIASSLAAERYKLKVLADSIQDSSHNITRFLVIGKTIAKPTGNDKTSVMFSVNDKIGALHDMLVPFKKYHINLTKIESRPSKKKAWEYYFFVDMIGHSESSKVKKALLSLKKRCSYIKILGSYPKGDLD